MSATSFTGRASVVWDDSVVFVFQFTDGGTRRNCGFVHTAQSSQVGSQTQVTPTLQSASAVQVGTDPATWIETVKNSHRGNDITIVYDDTINFGYTTQTAQIFQLQVLYSIAG